MPVQTNIYWIPGPWKGRLAISPRPRGGDWLSDELSSWRREGVGAIVSLLTAAETDELDLRKELQTANGLNLHFLSFPIVDRDVPSPSSAFEAFLVKLQALLAQGTNIVIHCRQGIGRSGLTAACLLTHGGISAEEAIERVQRARGAAIPDTEEQRLWIHDHALQDHLTKR